MNVGPSGHRLRAPSATWSASASPPSSIRQLTAQGPLSNERPCTKTGQLERVATTHANSLTFVFRHARVTVSPPSPFQANANAVAARFTRVGVPHRSACPRYCFNLGMLHQFNMYLTTRTFPLPVPIIPSLRFTLFFSNYLVKYQIHIFNVRQAFDIELN